MRSFERKEKKDSITCHLNYTLESALGWFGYILKYLKKHGRICIGDLKSYICFDFIFLKK
jgi:hypothetical protein